MSGEQTVKPISSGEQAFKRAVKECTEVGIEAMFEIVAEHYDRLQAIERIHRDALLLVGIRSVLLEYGFNSKNPTRIPFELSLWLEEHGARIGKRKDGPRIQT